MEISGKSSESTDTKKLEEHKEDGRPGSGNGIVVKKVALGHRKKRKYEGAHGGIRRKKIKKRGEYIGSEIQREKQKNALGGIMGGGRGGWG